MTIDYAFVNARIYTLDGRIAEAVAVSADKISCVGNSDEIKALCGPKTEVIDLKGKCMLPGFNDSHMHFLLYGLLRDKIDLSGATSIEEMISRGGKFVRESGRRAGEWIVGYGFDHNLFSEHRLPTKEDVDRISTEHPVLLDRVCGHIGILNSLAMQRLGITENTVIEGGSFHKSEDGQLDGIVEEAALDWIKSRIPKPGVRRIKEIIELTTEEALSCGLTSVQTDDLEATAFDTMFDSYTSMSEAGKLRIRIFEEVQAARPDKLKAFLDRGMRTGYGNDFFRIGNIKLITDGSLGARSAGMKEDYADKPGTKGILVYTQDELDEMVGIAHNAGMQVACHAIGDAAIERVVTAMERAINNNPKSLRHRVVHCQFSDDIIFDRMAKAGICADIQPPFVPSDYDIAEERLGAERAGKGYAWKTMLTHGIHMGGGSDCPVETFNPLWGIYCAVTRRDQKGNPVSGWHPEEKLSVEEAIRLYTIGSAYMSFDENKKGTITPGKFADLVVLSDDPFRTDPNNIKDIKVLYTVVGGKIQFSR